MADNNIVDNPPSLGGGRYPTPGNEPSLSTGIEKNLRGNALLAEYLDILAGDDAQKLMVVLIETLNTNAKLIPYIREKVLKDTGTARSNLSDYLSHDPQGSKLFEGIDNGLNKYEKTAKGHSGASYGPLSATYILLGICFKGSQFTPEELTYRALRSLYISNDIDSPIGQEILQRLRHASGSQT